MKRVRLRAIIAAVSALWLIGALVMVSARIQNQLDATRAIEAELGGGSILSQAGFFDVARVMLKYGGWQLAELGGAPVIALFFVGAIALGGRRPMRPFQLRRSSTTRFPSSPKRA
jgi:hypothetical protein